MGGHLRKASWGDSGDGHLENLLVDSGVGKVLVIQAGIPEFDPQNPCEKEVHTCNPSSVKEETGGSVGLNGQLASPTWRTAGETLSHNTGWTVSEEQQPRLICGPYIWENTPEHPYKPLTHIPCTQKIIQR